MLGNVGTMFDELVPCFGGSGAKLAAHVKRINQLRRELDQNPENMAAAVELADIYQRASMWDEAAGYYEQALAIGRKSSGYDHPDYAVWLNNLGSAHMSKGEYDNAIGYYEQSLAIDRKM